MERDAVVIAVKVRMLERELGVGVGAVHNHLNAALAGHLANLLNREDLAGQVGDVADVNYLRLRGDRVLN